MKQKKAHASHPVGNRTVIGIICIVVALAICFGIAPLVNRLSDGKTKIVRLTRDISAGATITEADIEVVDVGSYNLPAGVIKDKAQVVGKCALSNLTKGDYLFPSKIGNDTNNAGRMLESLDENHKAISITIGSFALGFSGKLETGDIVGILVYDQVENRSYTPKELTYVKVITTTTSSGVDKADVEDIINPLEPKEWSDNASDAEDDAPEAFRKATRLSQHISFLKDFFRVYKDFDDAQIDALEILLTRLYGKFGIHDDTDYSKLTAGDYPVMADLYEIVESEYMKYEKGTKSLFTEDLLRELCLGLNSMCVGAESKFFNGHTNISDDRFICFGVKGLMEANKKLKDAMLFNILSFMNHKLLTKGNTAASIDELYLFLTNLTAIEYIRNASKRVRKKDSSILLASQNIEDFLLPDIKELTKPLFSIPTHQFLFNGGNINAKDYIDALQLEESEFDLIKYPERGTCLFKCGNERYLLQVKAPEYKSKLFGDAGGR